MILEEYLQLDNNSILNSLDTYQEELVKELLNASNNNYLEAADRWLNANMSQTVSFGGDKKHSTIFREKIFEEVEKFICGCDDGRYDNERAQLSEETGKGKEFIISLMSAAIGAHLGVAGAFVAPVIVLIFLSLGKIVKNAWCETQIKLREIAEAK